MPLRCALALAALLLAAPAARAAAASAAPDPASDLARRLEVAPDDPLLAYGWDDEPEIPSSFATREVWIDWGELGLAPDTRVYLPFNEGAGARVRDVAAPDRALAAPALGWVRGRFGWAVELAGTSGLRLERKLPAEPLFDAQWTLELWVRPAAPLAAATLVAEAGSFSLALGADGRVVARLALAPDGAVELRSQAALEPERWHHVAVACDARELRSVRLVVDGRPSGARLAGAPARGTGALEIGGGPDGVLRGGLDELRLLARTLPSTELAAHARARPERGEHRRRLRFRSGVREERPWAGVLRAPALARAPGLAQGALRRVAPDDEGLRWVPGDWQRSRPPLAPLPRTAHPVVFVGGHRALVFGGEVRDSDLPPMVNGGDTWLFDLARERWERVDSPEAPSPRCHQAAAWSPDHDLLLLAGGWRNESRPKELFSDTWLFRVAARRWERRRPSGVALPRLSDSGVVYHPKLRRFLLFAYRDIFEYDPEADRWARRPPAEVLGGEETPQHRGPRISPMLGYDPTSGGIVRFGGAHDVDGERVYTDTTALYDAAANRWTILHPEVSPSPRVRSGFAWDARRGWFVLYGGVRDQFSQRESDLWTFEPARARWTRHGAANAPSARGGFYGMAYDAELDRFAVLAGRHSHRRFLDEAWLLSLDPAATGSATWVFDRSTFPDADRWWIDGEAPPGARIAARFATSDDGWHWSDPVDVPVASARFVRVEVELAPAPAGDAPPRIRGLGFARGAVPCAGRAGCRSGPIAPLAPAAATSRSEAATR